MIAISHKPKIKRHSSSKSHILSCSISIILHITIFCILVLIEEGFLSLSKGDIDNKMSYIELVSTEEENLFHPNFSLASESDLIKNFSQEIELKQEAQIELLAKKAEGYKKELNNYKQILSQHVSNAIFQNSIDLGNIQRVDVMLRLDKIGHIISIQLKPDNLPPQIKNSLLAVLRKSSPLPVPPYEITNKKYVFSLINEKMKRN